jgi:hypothetical protein
VDCPIAKTASWRGVLARCLTGGNSAFWIRLFWLSSGALLQHHQHARASPGRWPRRVGHVRVRALREWAAQLGRAGRLVFMF